MSDVTEMDLERIRVQVDILEDEIVKALNAVRELAIAGNLAGVVDYIDTLLEKVQEPGGEDDA